MGRYIHTNNYEIVLLTCKLKWMGIGLCKKYKVVWLHAWNILRTKIIRNDYRQKVCLITHLNIGDVSRIVLTKLEVA